MNIPYSQGYRRRNIRSILSFLSVLLFTSFHSNAQQFLDWEVLTDVSFEQKYDKTIKMYWLVPTFGKLPKAHEKKTVIMEGYFIPINRENNFYVLSRFPYSSCFFCGAAGPESVVELQINKKYVEHIRMDERIQFKGTFVLNASDYDHCNYILKEARPLKKK